MEYIINNKKYNSKEFDFAALIKLEECGVKMDDLQDVSKPLTLIVGVAAWIMDCSKEEATRQINEHIKNGGKLSDVTKMLESLENSDFFKKAMN